MKKTITTSFIIISLIALASCGSSGTTDSTSAPTITSLTDANSQTIESTGSTGIWPSSFTATFSDTIDATSFTTDNITMTCDLPDGSTVDQPTILIGEDTCVMEACTFSIEDAWKYALLDCTLTFTTGISTSVSRGKSTAFEENEIFTFTNACAVNDDFNADSESCWPTIYIPSDTGLVETDWATLNAIGYFTFNTTGSSFDFAPSGAAMAGISKEVVTGTDGFSATIHLKNPSGFTTDSGSAPEQISVQLADNPDLSEASITLAAGIAAIDPDGDDVYNQGCVVATAPVVIWEFCEDSTKEYFIRVTVDFGGNITAEYKDSTDEAYQPLSNYAGTAPTISDPTVFNNMIMFLFGGHENENAEIGSISTTGITSITQY